MAVTAVLKRLTHSQTTPFTTELCQAALTGTYVTGGFTFNPFAILSTPGSSPLGFSNFRAAIWISPLGYTYYSTVAGTVMTTKIFSAANTELANGAAVPDAVVNFMLYLSRT